MKKTRPPAATSRRTLPDSQQTHARLAAIVESSDDAIIGKDLDGIITSWNQGAERIFGYTASEAIGHSIVMLIPAERQNEEPRILERIRRGERIEHYETVRQRKDGTKIDISLTVSPIVNASGTVIGASKIARDITESKRSREATQRLYEIGKRCVRPGEDFIAILSTILDTAIWASRAHRGTVQLVDPSSEALKMVTQHGFSSPFVDVFASLDRHDAGAEYAALAAGERIIVDDVTTSANFAGQQPWLQALLDAGVRAMQSTPLTSSTGALIGVLATHFDRPHRPTDRECQLLDVLARQTSEYIERQRSEAQREELLLLAESARAEAEAANRAKDEFLAMLGHELRNPLSAVRNAIAAALLDPAAQGRALLIARRQTDQLGRIVDDLLDVARITHGRVALRKQRISLSDVLQRTVDGARALMDERGHNLVLSLPPEVIYLNADAARVEQAVMNLLTNAAKYTDPGGTVTVTAARDDGDAVVRVRDTGIGIAPDILPRVFDLFTQGHRSLDRAEGGLGIGLTLVRRIVELHGGTVQVKSAGRGEGTEFVMRLPALPAVAGDMAVTPPQVKRRPRAAHPTRVLMVEDNPDAAESLVLILELLGHHVRVVADGRAGLEAARANVPDIMLVDIGLPGLNGYELAQAIRRDPALKHVVLVALTGYGRPEDKADAVAAGFDYHFVKPVDLDALGDLVARLGTREESNETTRH
jgi:PAS domain S-box-containing protein